MNLRVVNRFGDRTIGVALLLPVGAYREAPGQDGIAHLIEHLLFKRTRTKPPAVLRRLENDAGFVDAFTDRDHSGFLCRTLPVDLPKTLDYLLDVVFGSAFTAGDLEAEREVVLQEIQEDADDPWAIAHDEYSRKGLGRYGRPVGGCPRTVRSLSIRDVRDFVRRHYRAATAEFSVCGPVGSSALVERIARRWDRGGRNADSDPGWADFAPLERYWSPRREYRMGYVCWGFPFRPLPLRDLLILRAFIATTGDGPSSILWRELREKRSLVYDLHVGVDRYRHAVSCHVSLATRHGRMRECLGVLNDTLAHWRRGRIDREDVRIALKMIRRGELARREDPLEWAASLAYGGLTGIEPDAVLSELSRLTPDHVIGRVREGLLPEPVIGRA